MKQGEIKFRVWDKILKFMRIPTQLTFHGNGEYSGFWVEGSAFSNKENYELMQYTGLKDKNGKEIYEGDLFDCIYKFDGCNRHKLVVGWNESSASFKLRGYGMCHQPNIEKTMGDLERLTVIGNIYENTELLEGDK